MDPGRIAELLDPFIGDGVSVPHPLLSSISIYLDVLLRWNARTNLTATQDPEEIVTRHFGESIFAARTILPDPAERLHLIDVGSGAGFPGLPVKLWAQDIQLTLIEANYKKATFLREVIRALKLSDCEVYDGRAENFLGTGDVVTLRAVERFKDVLPTTLRLVRPGGRIALLIAEPQKELAIASCRTIRWSDPIRLPQSERRILLIGRAYPLEQESA